MFRMSRADDDRILREMQAPDIEEAVEALGYWLGRHDRLPFYRRTARAEARRMIAYWQGRLLADAPRAPMQAIGHARQLAAVGGQLVAYRAGHVARRGALTVIGVGALIIFVAAR